MRYRRPNLLLAMLAAMAACADSVAFTEAPELQRQVQAGTLPPLAQRLPVAPLVVTPVSAPGTYGGAWRLVLIGHHSASTLSRVLAYEQLVRWDPNWTRVVPNLASHWTVNADSTVYRFQLRQGLRWSDGHAFTAHDIVAWMDDVARDPELGLSPGSWLASGGVLPECTAPDDFTLEFKFAAPNAVFLEQLAAMRANLMTRYPAHYFRPFHHRHDLDGAAALAKRTGLPWAAAFKTVYAPWTWTNVDVPTLDAWRLTAPYVVGVKWLEAVRNPYYWKIDTLGRQLPYLDTVRFEVVADDAEALQCALTGRVDYQRQDFAGTNHEAAAAIAAAVKAGRLTTVQVIPSRSNIFALCLNLTHQDRGLREVLGDKRVRIALSEAIDRPAINRELYRGQGRPWQVAPRPLTPFYNRRLGEQYTDYAPERARQSLEAAGLTVDPGDGIRRLRDGRPFKLRLLIRSPASPSWPAIMEQIGRDWRAVGVEVEWVQQPLLVFYPTVNQNQHDGAVMYGSGGYSPVLEPDFFVPAFFDTAAFASPWGLWFTDPHAPGAEVPPESVRRQMALFRRVLGEPNREARMALLNEVLDMAADEFYVIGVLMEPVRVAICTPGFRNVPASHFDSWLYPDPGPLNPCQFFIVPATSSTQ